MQRLSVLSWGIRPEEVEQMLVQRDGSRNSSFTMGMSLEEVKEQLDCNLITVTNSDVGTTNYWTEAPVDGSYLGFVFLRTLYVRFGKLLTKRAVSFDVKDKHEIPLSGERIR